VTLCTLLSEILLIFTFFSSCPRLYPHLSGFYSQKSRLFFPLSCFRSFSLPATPTVPGLLPPNPCTGKAAPLVIRRSHQSLIPEPLVPLVPLLFVAFFSREWFSCSLRLSRSFFVDYALSGLRNSLSFLANFFWARALPPGRFFGPPFSVVFSR